ncbi:MAG: TIGR03936 family radical SAM-associated protein [Planctomycetota bacterium]
MHGTDSNETLLVVIEFRIGGSLRFLSHAETLKLFRRAFARAGLPLKYTQGFNPHPRMSLPLPKSVGLQTEDDLLCVQIETLRSSFDSGRFKSVLAEELPSGCELTAVSLAPPRISFQPSAAAYAFPLAPHHLDPQLNSRIARLMASRTLTLQRRLDAKGNTREIDVRPFLRSVELRDDEVVVTAEVTPTGSIRPDEIAELLEFDAAHLAGPVTRRSVQWRQTGRTPNS